MKYLTPLSTIGIAVLLISMFVGAGGTIWGIRHSFASMALSESAGIGAVGGGIQIALISCVAGLIGILIGIFLVIIGRPKAKNDPEKP